MQIRRELLDLTRYYRRRHIGKLPHTGDPSALTAEIPNPADDGDLSGLEDWWRFHQEVDALPTEEREVVGLLFYHRWTQVEAAEMLGVTSTSNRSSGREYI